MNEQTQRLYEAADKLRNLREPSAIARVLGISQQTLKNWETRGISAQGMIDAERSLGCSAVWLGTGRGEMLGTGVARASGIRKVVTGGHTEPNFIGVRRVNLTVSAGVTGFRADEFEDEGSPFHVPEDWILQNGYMAEKLVAASISGESMEPTMSAGDTVIINTLDTTPADNKIFAVNFDGQAVVKRMSKDFGRWFLISDNHDQRRYHREECTSASCIIIGRVVMLQRVNI